MQSAFPKITTLLVFAAQAVDNSSSDAMPGTVEPILNWWGLENERQGCKCIGGGGGGCGHPPPEDSSYIHS